MRKKTHQPHSIRLSPKARTYFEQVGLLDARTGRKRKDTEGQIAEVFNRAIISYFETGKHTSLDTPPVWMLKAIHMRHEIAEVESQVRELAERLRSLYGKLERIPGLDHDWLEQQNKFDVEAKRRKEERENRPARVFHRTQVGLDRFRHVAANPQRTPERYINTPRRVESTDESPELTTG